MFGGTSIRHNEEDDVGTVFTRVIKGTSTEMALSVLAFNMIRSINLGAMPN
jgi:hypothetical protein